MQNKQEVGPVVEESQTSRGVALLKRIVGKIGSALSTKPSTLIEKLCNRTPSATPNERSTLPVTTYFDPPRI